MSLDLLPRLECRKDHGTLIQHPDHLECAICHTSYPIRNGAMVFEEPPAEIAPTNIGDPLVFKLKSYFKRFHSLYYVLVRIAGALFVGRKTGLSAFKNLPAGSVIINLGSGPKVMPGDIVNLDSFPFQGVAVCADAARLPFKDNSVDAIMCECVLEHVTNPVEVVTEMRRVLKIGGLAYVSIPFMDPYHSAPDDYYRWTTSGLRELMKGFDEKELRIAFGPTSTLVAAISHWTGIVLSFGSRTLYQLITLGMSVILSPLKLLDYILRDVPYATNATVGYYFIGAKKEN